MIIYVDFRKRPNLGDDNPVLGMIIAGLISIPFWLFVWPILCAVLSL
jgi:hypothetical protein